MTVEKSQVIDFEGKIDNYFDNVPLPTDEQSLSIWHLCTVTEDSLRLVIDSLRNISNEPEILIKSILQSQSFVDRQGYTLKYALNAIFRRQKPERLPASWKPKVDEDTFMRSVEFMKLANDYSLAVTAFSNYHSGSHTNCTFDSQKKLLKFQFEDIKRAYSALHIFLSSRSVDENTTPLGQLLIWFLDQSQWPEGIRQAVYNTRKKGIAVKYKFASSVMQNLINDFSSPPQMVPDNWSFPWATVKEARQFFKALQVWCMCHLLAVHFGSLRLSVQGIGLISLCPILSQRRFIREIATFSDLDTRKINDIIKYFKLGAFVDTPDPVLQPFIPMGENIFTIPPITTISSNYERNFLSLHARIDNQSFDSQSSVFEEIMIQSTETVVREKYSFYKTRVFIPQQRRDGEIDLIIADPLSGIGLEYAS